MPIDPNRAQAVFLAALSQPAPADRLRYLDEACGPDVELRQRVELLLRAHDDPGSFLGMPAADPGATADPQPDRVEAPAGTVDAAVDPRRRPHLALGHLRARGSALPRRQVRGVRSVLSTGPCTGHVLA